MTTKASDTLARELTERILGGEFGEGTALPTERALVEQTGTSRATVREALRVLESRGLVAIRLGRTGGAFVRRPDEQSLASTVDLVARGLRPASVHEAREAIEPSCARLAARHRTDDDLARLEAADAAIAGAAGLEDFLAANVAWHVAVATAGHNEILAGIMIALSRAILASTDDADLVDDAVRAATVAAHRAITRAVRDRDPEAASRRMARHVHAWTETASGGSQ